MEFPGQDAEVAALVRSAARHGGRVVVRGSGLAPADAPPDGGEGRTLPAPDLTLSTRGLAGIREYDPADLTITAGAGTLLSELAPLLAAEGQWLPMDPPGGGAVTLGGMVATGLPGPLALGFGRPRDHLLGLTLVDGRGDLLGLGGRVVKNVAGFDLVRLAAGSRGRLGVVTEVTLRLFPLPPGDRTLVWRFPHLEDGWAGGWALAALPFPFAAAELFGAEGGGVEAAFRLTGSAGELATGERLLEAVAGAPELRAEGEESRRFWQLRSEAEGAGSPTFRGAVRPTRGGELLRKIVPPGLPEPGRAFRWALHLRKGVLRVDWEGGSEVDDASEREEGGADPSSWIRETLAWVEEVGGSGRVGRLPGGGTVSAGRGGGVRALEERIRQVFDPEGVFGGGSEAG